MANFGPHRYYRIRVADYVSKTYAWRINSMFIPASGCFLGDNTNVSSAYYTGLPQKHGFFRYFDETQISTTATVDASGFDEIVHRQDWKSVSSGWYSSRGSSVVPDYGDIDFGQPVYIPVWMMSETFDIDNSSYASITKLEFYYSDNGTDWTLIKSFEDQTNGVFHRITDEFVTFVLGDYLYQKNVGIETYSLPVSNVSEKAISGVYKLPNKLHEVLRTGSYFLHANSDDSIFLSKVYFTLTGGATNTNPENSLGGEPSQQLLPQELYWVDEQAPGVSLIRSSMLLLGKSTIKVTKDVSGTWWAQLFTSDGLAGSSPIVADGFCAIVSGLGAIEGHIVLDIAYSLLEEGEYDIWVGNKRNWLIPEVTKEDSFYGKKVYKAIALHNTYSDSVMNGVKVYLKHNTLDSRIRLGLAQESPGTPLQSIANENTAPTGVSFSYPYKNNPIVVDIPVNSYVGLWIENSVERYDNRNIAATTATILVEK